MTPAETLQEVYALAVEQARSDVRAKAHVPGTLFAVVCSPHNPPELRVVPVLDPRQVGHLMRAAVLDTPAIYGFAFVGMGTVIHERPAPPHRALPALLTFWVHRHDAGGACYFALPGVTHEAVEPLPVAQRRVYMDALDPATSLLPMTAAPPS